MLVYQANNGDYWFGSSGEGAFRYDGRSIYRYTVAQGLPDNRIVGIQEDRRGRLYFDTGKGICQLSDHRLKVLELIDSPATHKKWELAEGDLWFRGSWEENGPYRYDGQTLHRLKFPDHPLHKKAKLKHPNASYSPYGIYAIFRDRDGSVWFGTSNLGVCRYDGRAIRWVYEDSLTELDDGPAPGVRSILQDSTGGYWFSNDLPHRYRVFGKGESPLASQAFYKQFPGIDVAQAPGLEPYCMSITEDDGGDIWFATYDKGVWRYDGAKLTHYSVEDDGKPVTLFSIYKDRRGGLWVGTHQAGVYRLQGDAFERFHPGGSP